jgi:small subunit ribosomal protein S20
LTGYQLIYIYSNLNKLQKGVCTLANHKSAIKRAGQNEMRRLRNKSTKTRVKSIVKDVRSTVAESSGEKATAKIIAAQSIIDKAAKKGVIHKKTAARKISRLTKLGNSAKA